MFDGEAFGKEIVAATKAHIDKMVKPLLKQIEAMKVEIDALKQQPVAKEVKPEDVAAIISDNFRKDVDALRSTVDALPKKVPELPDIPAMVSDAVKAAMPEPADVKALVSEAVAALPPAKDGQDGAPGAKGDAGDVGPAGKSGSDGINGKDGTGLAGAMIDRMGTLILTLTDGTTRELGHVVGKDVDMIIVEGMIDKATHKAIAEARAAIPEPNDGERGPQGEPGKSITIEDVAPLIETAVAKRVETIERMVPDVVKSAVSSIKVPDAPQLPDIDAMVTKAVMALPAAQDGKDADPALVQSLVKETVERAVASLPVAKDGESVTIEDVRPIIEAEVNKAAASMPVPKDGASVTLDDVRPLIDEAVTKAVTSFPLPKDGVDGKDGASGIDGKDGADGRDGQDGATVEELRPLIDETVAKSVSAIPVPRDGKDGAPGLDGKDGSDGLAGKDGRDGLDVKDMLVVEGGELVATFTDGRTKVLGQFRGKDGDPGKDGADGANGKDGSDGIGFDDVTEEFEDEGRVIVRQFFNNGALIKESRITTKMAVFRGVHDQSRTYQPGDMVSRGGSLWHCDAECKGPFNGDFWTLSVKKGRDGKPD